MALLVPVAVVAATSSGFLQLVAVSFRFAAVLAVAANRPVQVFLRLVDALLAVIARPRAGRAAHQQQAGQDGNQLKTLPTTSLLLHHDLLDNHIFGTGPTVAGIPIQGPKGR
jgi:hypothetical protein